MRFSLQRSLLMRVRYYSSGLENAKPFSAIPTPSTYSMIRGSLPGGKYDKKTMNEMMKLFQEEYGNIVRFPAMLGRPEVVTVYRPEDMEKVYRVEGAWPERMGFETLKYYKKTVRPDVYGKYEGLFTAQDEKWHNMRTIANPILLQPKIVKRYTSQVDDIAREFVDIMKTLRDDKSEMPADFSNYLNSWSLESVVSIALEKRLHVMSGQITDKTAQELIKLIRKFFEQTVEFEAKLTIWRYYQTKAFKELMEVYDGITNIILHYIEEAKKEIEQGKLSEGDQEESILRKFLKINEEAAVSVVSDFLLAGVDTTASTSTFTLYCLAKNPDKQEILREEIFKVLPKKDAPLTPENMKNMPYLRATIKEAMRAFPLVVGSARKITKDLVLSGYHVPANTQVSMITLLQAKDSNQFKEAEKFSPERWLRATKECPHQGKTHHPFAFTPFGFGSRMCVGRRLAELEMEVLLIRILRSFKLEWHHEDMKVKEALVSIPNSELRFKVIDL